MHLSSSTLTAFGNDFYLHLLFSSACLSLFLSASCKANILVLGSPHCTGSKFQFASKGGGETWSECLHGGSWVLHLLFVVILVLTHPGVRENWYCWCAECAQSRQPLFCALPAGPERRPDLILAVESRHLFENLREEVALAQCRVYLSCNITKTTVTTSVWLLFL